MVTPIFYILTIIYFLSRLINLDALPLFNDEACYFNWARLIVAHGWRQIFISLTEGQPPLYIWLLVPIFKLNLSNFLLAARTLSVLFGWGTMVMLLNLGRELFNKRIGTWAAFFYIMTPFALWYDRLAIKDSLLMFYASCLFYFALRQAKTKQWRYVIGAGLILGLSLLTKAIAYFFVGLYPIIVILYRSHIGKLKFSVGNFKKFFIIDCLPLLVSLILASGIASIVYLSPLHKTIAPYNDYFLLSYGEFFRFPVQMWKNNFYSTIIWWWQYYSWPILAMGGVGLLILIRQSFRLAIMLSCWIVLPIAFEVFMAEIYLPRYFLFTLAAFSLLVALGLDFLWTSVKKPFLKVLIIGLMLLPGLKLNRQILFKIKDAQLPQVERWQYLEGWPSGYGFKELADFLENQYLAKGKKLIIATEIETLVSSGLPLYVTNFKELEIKKIFEPTGLLPSFPQELEQKDKQILVILYHHQKVPEDWPVQKVAQIGHGSGNGEKSFLVYELTE